MNCGILLPLDRAAHGRADVNRIDANIPPEKRQRGRPKGSPNKTTALLKDALLRAADEAGGKEGLVGYLRRQAEENPGPFLTLLGKVLPLQVNSAMQGQLSIRWVDKNEPGLDA